VVAFVFSTIVTLLCCAAVVWYARRRPVGTPVSWGEAMLASTFVFSVLFLAYGIVPHQWLRWAEAELNLRPDRLIEGPFGVVGALPFDFSYEAMRDILAVGLYGAFLVLHVWMWMYWQNRGREKPKELPTSAYGRPLVKKV
jgi:hypothetical protein